MECKVCNGDWYRKLEVPVLERHGNQIVQSSIKMFNICHECLGNHEHNMSDLQGTGSLWHRQRVLPDDFEIIEETVDRKLFCGRCLGAGIICDMCMGNGFYYINLSYGGGYPVWCGGCQKNGICPLSKDETQEIKL